MYFRFLIIVALALTAATLTACSFTYSRPMTPEENEYLRRALAEAIRESLRKSELVLRMTDVIYSDEAVPEVPLGLSVKSRDAAGRFFGEAIRDAGEISRKGAPVIQDILGALQVPGFDPPKHVDQPKDLKLVVVDTGVPLANVDTATGVFTLDALVLRAIFISGIASLFGDEDVETALADLRAAKQLESEGRRDRIDQEAQLRFSKLPTAKKARHSDPQKFAAMYVQVLREIISLPDSVYQASYQLANGKVVRPRAIAWDLYAGQAFSQTLEASVMGAFNTVLVHEVGHVAMRHRPDLQLSCERRKMMELQADGYSAALRAVGRLDSKYPLAAGFLDSFTIAMGGVVKATGIDSYYDMAYRISGFDGGLKGAAPATQSCYPSAEDRKRLAKAINEVISEMASKQALESVNKCLADKASASFEEDLKTLENGGGVSTSVDISRECKK